MEAGKPIFFPPSIRAPKTQLRNSYFCSAITPFVNEQAPVAVTSAPTTSLVRHFPTSVLLQEHDFRASSNADRVLQGTLDRKHIEKRCAYHEVGNSDHFYKDFQRQLLNSPGFWYLFPLAFTENRASLPSWETLEHRDEGLKIKPGFTVEEDPITAGQLNALALARTAVLASKEAAFLADSFDSSEEMLVPTYTSSCLWQIGRDSFKDSLEGRVTVKSNRLLERRSKKRKVPKKPKTGADGLHLSNLKELYAKINAISSDPNDPFRLFLSGSDKRQLLTANEERELVVKIQDVMRVKEVKARLELQFDREATLAEWAQAVGMNCRVLQACINSGNSSRKKMIYSNFRLVVHIAKQYQGKGLSIQDLLQEGSMGLMKSLEKFKPQAGCRFSTYAYWWIRQSIRKAIFLKSRTIRLPENVYTLLARVKNVRNSFRQAGHIPSNGDLAKGVGVSVAKLENFLLSTQIPVSIQRPAWGSEEDVTFQEITADPKVDLPEVMVAKQLMRQQVQNLLTTLRPKERQIIQLRYGICDGEKKSLSDIGAVFGISKERVRQVESKALEKLKNCIFSQGLEAYINLLI